MSLTPLINTYFYENSFQQINIQQIYLRLSALSQCFYSSYLTAPIVTKTSQHEKSTNHKHQQKWPARSTKDSNTNSTLQTWTPVTSISQTTTIYCKYKSTCVKYRKTVFLWYIVRTNENRNPLRMRNLSLTSSTIWAKTYSINVINVCKFHD